MSDLIDLNSPNARRLKSSKLASPLIPVPRNVESIKDSLVPEKRESLDNNPFDNVLHETTEYVKKKGDPFEVMLQRALKFKSKKNVESKTQLVEFMDDFTPKRRRKYQKMLNKTLDESLIKDNVDEGKKKKEADCATLADNSNITCDDATIENNKSILDQDNKVKAVDADSLELSILNQSAMNDTLLEPNFKYKLDNEMSVFPEKEFNFSANSNLKPYSYFQRSLSQGEQLPNKLSVQDRRHSATDRLRKSSQNDCSVLLDKSPLENKQKELYFYYVNETVISNLSDVSCISKLNSLSLTPNLSLASSNGIMNNAFVDSNNLKMSNEIINTTKNSPGIKSVQYDLSDLTERLNKLKCAVTRTTNILSTKKEIVKSNCTQEEDKQIVDNKLIDVDTPEFNFSREHNNTISSTSSSDSVFVDDRKFNKSILIEAKALARTFEELALDSGSSESVDDLISNNQLWMSELLPAYEDERVGNLIELPVSPKKSGKIDEGKDLKQYPTNTNDVKENFTKDVESQFTDCTSTEKMQAMVTSLLLDLKKLVKTDDNPEASTLIDNLENVLGVNYKSNMELLTSLNVSNKIQNAQLSDDESNNSNQSDKMSNNKSQEHNEKILSDEKICDNENVSCVNNKSEETLQTTPTSSDKSSAKISLCNNDSEDNLNIVNLPETELKDCQSDEKLAVELLVNLGKLLSGQTKDTMTLQLLKSIGKALNVASNHCKIESESLTNDSSRNAQRIASVDTSKSEHNVSMSNSKQVGHERSFSSKVKILEKPKKRSASLNRLTTNTSNTPIKRKSVSEFKDQTYLSNNSGFINTMMNKKMPILGTSNTKTEIVELGNKNEKPLAIIDVKSKLKKQLSTVSSRGPMKAFHPVGNMQTKTSFGKQTIPSFEVITPPKYYTVSSGNKIISSTPNSLTPNGQNNESSKTQLMPTSKKRNLSCEISPVVTHKRDSPKRSNKLPATKKCTPKRQHSDASGIPKYCTPPRKLSTSFDISNHHQQSPQYLNKSLTGYQRHSPIRSKSIEKQLRSPLKDSNKNFVKVKPLKLISKLKGNVAADVAEKENYLK